MCVWLLVVDSSEFPTSFHPAKEPHRHQTKQQLNMIRQTTLFIVGRGRGNGIVTVFNVFLFVRNAA